MGLLIWLPLKGNTDNLGQSETIQFVDYNASGVSWSESGKLGSALSLSGGCKLANWNFTLGNAASMSCWVYYTERPANNDWMFSLATASGTANTALGIVTYNTYLTLCVGGKSANWTYTLETGKWYHFCMTWNGSVATLYKDGASVFTSTGLNGGTKTSTTKICLGGNGSATSSTRMKGMLNDVRVYDHCLSAKEVHDLAMGLILHWPLNSKEIATSKCSAVTLNQLVSNGNFENGTVGWDLKDSSTSFTASNGELTLTKIRGDYGGMCRCTSITPDPTHIYYIRAILKTNSSGTIANFGFCKSDWTVGSNTQVSTTSMEYVDLSALATPDSSSSRLVLRTGAGASPNGVNLACRLAMCIDLTLMFGSGNEPTKDECDRIFSGPYISYSTGASTNMIKTVPDAAGLGGDATLVNAVTLLSDTPRYDMSSKFGVTSYMKCVSPSSEAKTASFWMKIPGAATTNHVVFVDRKSKLGFGLNGNGCLCSTTGQTGRYKTKSTITANEWHHIAVVNTGTGVADTCRILYVDGTVCENNSSVTTVDSWNHTVNELQVGKRSYNASQPTGLTTQISDFRLYATALTADDVMDLYRTSEAIDKEGDVLCFTVSENYGDSELLANGTAQSNTLVEPCPRTMTLTDGSLWVQVLHHNNPASNMFTSANCWNYDDESNLYSALHLMKNPDWKVNGVYELLAEEKLTSSGTVSQYRWTQTSNPATSSSVTGFTAITGSGGNFTGLQLDTRHGCMSHAGSTWWCCCGAFTQYNGGIPGFGGTVTSGCLDLYIRVRSGEVSGAESGTAAIYKEAITATEFVES